MKKLILLQGGVCGVTQADEFNITFAEIENVEVKTILNIGGTQINSLIIKMYTSNEYIFNQFSYEECEEIKNKINNEILRINHSK